MVAVGYYGDVVSIGAPVRTISSAGLSVAIHFTRTHLVGLRMVASMGVIIM